MDLPELQEAYQAAMWKEILPDVLVGFGVIIPLFLAAAWMANRQEGTPQRAGYRFDFIAALALCAWLGYFVGQRLVFMMERPDKWAIGTLLGAALCAFALLLASRGGPNAADEGIQSKPHLPEVPAFKDIQKNWRKFLEAHPIQNFLIESLRHRLIPSISGFAKHSIPVVIRGLAVFCLASSTSTYSFLVSKTKVVITVTKPSDQTEWPTFGTCFLGTTASSSSDQGGSEAGRTLPYRVTAPETDSKVVTLWLDGAAAGLIGAATWRISMTLPDPEDPATVKQIDVAMNSLAVEAQGWLNIQVYRIEKPLP